MAELVLGILCSVLIPLGLFGIVVGGVNAQHKVNREFLVYTPTALVFVWAIIMNISATVGHCKPKIYSEAIAAETSN